MRSCWILYDRSDLEINRFFAESLCSHGRGMGLKTSVVVTDSIPDGVPDLVVSRTRDFQLTRSLEEGGSVVVNPSRVSEICNDKVSTLEFAESLGIPYLPYSVPDEPLPPGPPWVVKSRIGHGGTEVFMVRNESELAIVAGDLSERMPMIQSVAPRLGADMRCYMSEGRLIASVLRTSDSDFRANYKLGGEVGLCEPPEEVYGILKKVDEGLDADFIGVDFLFGNDGEVYLNEIEDVVGTRMLYKLTDMDPALMIMEIVNGK